MTLDEKQTKFLDALYDEAQGDLDAAASIAGYGERMGQKIANTMKEQITEKTIEVLSTKGAVKALYKMLSIFDNPEQVGKKETIAAAKDILDRAGFKPKDEVKVETVTPLFILPSKESSDEEVY